MRVMVDTNVLFSAIFFPNGKAARALWHCLSTHELVIPSYVISELKDVVRRKSPDKLGAIEVFLEKLSFDLVYTPEQIKEGEFYIRDPKDYPILYTAIIENVDLVMSGDEDFKDTDVTHPEIVTPAEFLDRY